MTGGGHSWPGSEFSQAVASVVGPTTMSISADELMWKFFQAHPLPELSAFGETTSARAGAPGPGLGGPSGNTKNISCVA